MHRHFVQRIEDQKVPSESGHFVVGPFDGLRLLHVHGLALTIPTSKSDTPGSSHLMGLDSKNFPTIWGGGDRPSVSVGRLNVRDRKTR